MTCCSLARFQENCKSVFLPDLSVTEGIFGVRSPSTLPSFNATHAVTDRASLIAAWSAAQPGDAIILADGVYDFGATFLTGLSGTSAAPVWVIPQTLLGAELVGATEIRTTGDFINVQGVRVRDTTSLSHAWRFVGDNNRFLSNELVRMAQAGLGIGFYGSFNEAADNLSDDNFVTFIEPDQSSIANPLPTPKQNWYHHNTFTNQNPLFIGNAGSPINLGFGYSPPFNPDTAHGSIVEWNDFVDYQRDGEIVSIKSDDNIVRFNRSSNTLRSHYSVRLGDNNLIYGNIMTGTWLGWRTSGANNAFLYNYLQVEPSPIAAVHAANPTLPSATPPLQSYLASVGNKTCRNFVIGRTPAHRIERIVGLDSVTALPTGNTFEENILLMTHYPTVLDLANENHPVNEFLKSNPIGDNAFFVESAPGSYDNACGVEFDFEAPKTLPNSIHGPITVSLADVPWLSGVLADA